RASSVPGERHLPRRQVHLRQLRRPGEAHHLRDQGRQAGPGQFRLREWDLYHPENRRERLPGDRKAQSRIPAPGERELAMAGKRPKPITWQWLEQELAKWIHRAEAAPEGRAQSRFERLLSARRSNESAPCS